MRGAAARPLSPPELLPLDPSVAVGRLSMAERPQAVALIAQRWPPLVLKAFDIDEERLESRCLHPAYAAAGLNRERVGIALRRRGRLIGVALCESTRGPISLFNTLNAAQVFLVAAAMPTAHECRALILAVRGFFCDLGVDSPLIAADPGTLSEDPAAGLLLVETMGCIVWSADGLRQYDSYVDKTIASYPN
jgi:hypothetical protein